MVEPALTIVRYEHSVYCAYPRKDLVSGGSGVHVLARIWRDLLEDYMLVPSPHVFKPPDVVLAVFSMS
jgi:hypothetical protein